MKSENLSNILKSSGFKNIELDNIIESKYILKRSGGNFRQYSLKAPRLISNTEEIVNEHGDVEPWE